MESNKPVDILSKDEIQVIKSSLKSDDSEDSEAGEIDDEKIKESVIKEHQAVFKQNEEEIGKRWNFEDGVSETSMVKGGLSARISF